MKTVVLNDGNRAYFSGLDPLMIMDRERKTGALCLGAVMREKNGEMPAGLIVFNLSDDELIIYWIYVEPGYRGQGIGEELLEAVFELARESGRSFVTAHIPGEYGKDLVCKDCEKFFRLNGFHYEENTPGRPEKLLKAWIYENSEEEKALPYGIFDKLLYENDEEAVYEDKKPERSIEKNDLVLTVADIAEAAGDGKRDVIAAADLTLQDLEAAVRRCLKKHRCDTCEGDLLKTDPAWFDLQISSCVIRDGEVSGLFLIHKEEDGSLWPEYLFDCAKQPAPGLVKMMEKSAALAIKNYPPETKVVLRIKTAEVRELAEMMLPGRVR